MNTAQLLLLATVILAEGGDDPDVRATADLAEHFRAAGYPAEALRREEQGMVSFRVKVGEDGAPTDCQVVESSGSRALDEGTCEIVLRAQFTPARDDAGHPVVDHILERVSWVLPPEPASSPVARANLASYVAQDDYPASAMRRGEQGTVQFALDISIEGRATDCLVTVSSGSPALDERTCRIMTSRARFDPARDAEGNPVTDILRGEITWTIGTRRFDQRR